MDGFRDIAANVNPDQDDALVNKIGRELELASVGTITGIGKGITNTVTRPDSLLTVAGGAAVGAGLSALQLRKPEFRVAGAVLASGFAYFGLNDIWNRAPALSNAIADTWDSSRNMERNINTFGDNFGKPAWDAYLFWGAGKLASKATTGFLYRRGGPLMEVRESWWGERTMVPHKRTDEIAQAYENTRHGIVQIQIPMHDMKHNALATGFLVSTDGKIATNAHVALHALENPAKTTIFTSQGESLTARVLKFDPVNDLALLKINEVDKLGAMRPLRLGSGNPPAGETVYVAGHPLGDSKLSITRGVYMHNNQAIAEVRKNIEPKLPWEENVKTRVSMPWRDENMVPREGFEAHKVTRGVMHVRTESGMSGGPVFDKSGTVFGVHHSSSARTPSSFHSGVNALKALLSSS